MLVVSGVAILLAHPRLYWGETGALGTPSLVDLPLPFVLDVPIRGPGRYLHFLAAWVSVFTGLRVRRRGACWRVTSRGTCCRRARELTLGAIRRVIGNHLRFKRSSEDELASYNVLQRLSYTGVVFVLFPLMIWTGLAMSPAVTSVFPFMVTVLGGQQTRAHASFRRGLRARPLPARPRRGGLPDGLQEPHASHDHGTRPRSKGAVMSGIFRGES